MTQGEQASFWQAANRAAKEIATWPKWKRDAADAQLQITREWRGGQLMLKQDLGNGFEIVPGERALQLKEADSGVVIAEVTVHGMICIVRQNPMPEFPYHVDIESMSALVGAWSEWKIWRRLGQ